MAKIKKIKREGKWKYFVDDVEVNSSVYLNAYAQNRGYKNIYRLGNEKNYKTYRKEKLQCRLHEEFIDKPENLLPIPSAPDYYANTEGKIWCYSNKRKRWIQLRSYSNPNNNYYCTVQPYIDGKRYIKYVHRLVAEAFLGEIPSTHEVNHIDRDVTNNYIDNLEILPVEVHRALKRIRRNKK
jgi:hypothetical protein